MALLCKSLSAAGLRQGGRPTEGLPRPSVGTGRAPALWMLLRRQPAAQHCSKAGPHVQRSKSHRGAPRQRCPDPA